jgi:2-polyprenyl-3-methyl-5-hydroxy-6-metoxy-1,4-benzoquinol methylase
MSSNLKLDRCLCCGGEHLEQFIDLGTQPLANAFHKIDQVVDAFPLDVYVCMDCWHSQLGTSVDRDLLFKHYLYVSGTSETFKKYCNWFADFVYFTYMRISNYAKYDGISVLDIACNDGTQLDAFKKFNWKTYGVDPAENLAPMTARKGHIVITGYWPQAAPELPEKVDIIVAQNVFAHVNDVQSFLTACKDALNDNGLIFIQTSQANMIQNGEFDTIYHEHISFFNTNSMQTLCERVGLFLTGITKLDIHGTSYVFAISKNELDKNSRAITERIELEKKEGLHDIWTYRDFNKKAETTINALRLLKNSITTPLVGYGAAAKGMTVLNASQLKLDYIVDDNPLKQGLYSPGMNIPIVPASKLLEEPEAKTFIVLPWNFKDEIIEKIKKVHNNPNDKFITYFALDT